MKYPGSVGCVFFSSGGLKSSFCFSFSPFLASIPSSRLCLAACLYSWAAQWACSIGHYPLWYFPLFFLILIFAGQYPGMEADLKLFICSVGADGCGCWVSITTAPPPHPPPPPDFDCVCCFFFFFFKSALHCFPVVQFLSFFFICSEMLEMTWCKDVWQAVQTLKCCLFSSCFHFFHLHWFNQRHPSVDRCPSCNPVWTFLLV